MVIQRVDHIHRLHQDTPNKAALAAAMTVHADLRGLWERAGWIVARLTEERLKREGLWNQDDQLRQKGRQSPGEVAVAREAATWATERLGGATSARILNIKIGSLSLNATSEEDVIKRTNRKHRRFRILHASVGLAGYGCPPEMVRLAISLHPHQVREMDEDGNLPIHIAATASSFVTSANEASPSTVAAAAAAAADVSDDLSVLSDTMSFFSSASVSQTTNPFDKVIKLLLQHYPEGACIPQGHTGQLPLVSAIQSGYRTWEDGIRTLVNAYPPGLHNKKLIHSSLYANVLALVNNSCQDQNTSTVEDCFRPSRHSKHRRHEAGARTTLFELLRSKPDWITEGNAQEETC
jgi:hypothetical protein